MIKIYNDDNGLKKTNIIKYNIKNLNNDNNDIVLVNYNNSIYYNILPLGLLLLLLYKL